MPRLYANTLPFSMRVVDLLEFRYLWWGGQVFWNQSPAQTLRDDWIISLKKNIFMGKFSRTESQSQQLRQVFTSPILGGITQSFLLQPYS